MKSINESEQASAAVALVVTQKSPSILLVRRVEHESDPWSGHWAFPGGRVDDSDVDLIATCQREVLEECGCSLKQEQFQCALPLAKAGRLHNQAVTVAPFVWQIPEPIELTLEASEIASASWVKLSYLSNRENHANGVISPKYSNREFPYIHMEDTPLWGFTYNVLMGYLNEG